jgi:hypothetical protein
MSSGFLVGRSATGRDNAAQVTDDGALKVDIGSATLSVTADGVEIKNDSGNPIPIADAGGSITVDGPLTNAELRAASVDVEPLGVPSVARQLTAGSASANTALTSTCRRISIKAVGADIRYAIGSSSQTASATSHFIGNGERLDLAVPATPNIAVLRNGSTDGTLELTELS